MHEVTAGRLGRLGRRLGLVRLEGHGEDHAGEHHPRGQGQQGQVLGRLSQLVHRPPDDQQCRCRSGQQVRSNVYSLPTLPSPCDWDDVHSTTGTRTLPETLRQSGRKCRLGHHTGMDQSPWPTGRAMSSSAGCRASGSGWSSSSTRPGCRWWWSTTSPTPAWSGMVEAWDIPYIVGSPRIGGVLERGRPGRGPGRGLRRAHRGPDPGDRAAGQRAAARHPGGGPVGQRRRGRGRDPGHRARHRARRGRAGRPVHRRGLPGPRLATRSSWAGPGS